MSCPLFFAKSDPTSYSCDECLRRRRPTFRGAGGRCKGQPRPVCARRGGVRFRLSSERSVGLPSRAHCSKGQTDVQIQPPPGRCREDFQRALVSEGWPNANRSAAARHLTGGSRGPPATPAAHKRSLLKKASRHRASRSGERPGSKGRQLDAATFPGPGNDRRASNGRPAMPSRSKIIIHQ